MRTATFVTIDGVVQHKDTYSVSGTTLTFSAAPPNGSAVECISFANTTTTTTKLIQDADEDTKIQVEESSDEDKIRFDTGGTERAIIDSTGLGVGTSSPEEALHVSGNMVLDRAAPRLFLQTGSSHYNWKVAAQDSVNKGFEISSGEVDADANSDTFTSRLVIAGYRKHRYWYLTKYT